MRPINLTKERSRDRDSKASDREIAALRAINGAANWLSSQSRPDLSVQTSFSQQCFPAPCVKDLQFANQLVHRARQYSDTEITVKHVDWDKLAVAFHSGAGFSNAKGHKTQAGYLVSFVDQCMSLNQTSPWSPCTWRSYKMPRVVGSTLAAEAQAYATASAVAEWVALLIAEAKQGRFDLRGSDQLADSPLSMQAFGWKLIDEIKRVPIIGMTDCKSLYDHLRSMSSVSTCDDKRVAIDIAILKQCMHRTNLQVRWVPTHLMLADAVTKDHMDPADLLRAALRSGEYQLNDEAKVLQLKKDHRQERLQRRVRQANMEKQQKQQKQSKRKK